MESLTFFGVSMEYFGVSNRLFDHFVLISFRSYGGILTSPVIVELTGILFLAWKKYASPFGDVYAQRGISSCNKFLYISQNFVQRLQLRCKDHS